MWRIGVFCSLLFSLAVLGGCGGSDRIPAGGVNGDEAVQTPLPGLAVRTTRAAATKVDVLAPETLPFLLIGVYGAPVTHLGYAPLKLTGDAWPRVTGTINVGDGAREVAFAPGGAVAYVTNHLASTVSVINTSTRSVIATVSVGNTPEGVAFAPGGAVAYVANYNSDTVSVIDTTTHTVTGTINVGDGPVGVAFAPDGSVAYVTNYAAGTVSVIDASTHVVTDTLSVGLNPHGVAFAPDGSVAYVTHDTVDRVSVIDPSIPSVTGTLNVGDTPRGVAFAPDGSVAYVANFYADTVSVIDVANQTVTGTINVGDSPVRVAFAPDGAVAYVTNFDAGTVSVIDTSTHSVKSTLTLGNYPGGVAFAPDGAVAYVATYTADRVSVIERSGRRVFIGSNGTDQGFNPPFGSLRAGALIAWGRKQQPPWVSGTARPELKACLMVDTPTEQRSTLAMELRGGVLATAVLTAQTISKLWLDRGPGQEPQKLIDNGGIFPQQYGQPYVLVNFDMETGELFAVAPTKSRAGRAGEVPYRIEEAGNRVTWRGDFAGVYAAEAGRNIAPEGATAVTIEAGTGRIVDLER